MVNYSDRRVLDVVGDLRTLACTSAMLSSDRLGRILFGRFGLASASPLENLSYKRYNEFAEGALYIYFSPCTTYFVECQFQQSENVRDV